MTDNPDTLTLEDLNKAVKQMKAHRPQPTRLHVHDHIYDYLEGQGVDMRNYIRGMMKPLDES